MTQKQRIEQLEREVAELKAHIKDLYSAMRNIPHPDKPMQYGRGIVQARDVLLRERITF